MGQRYSRILEAAKLAPQLDAFLDYQKNSARRGSRVGKGKPRPKGMDLYVIPFQIPVHASQKVRATGSVDAFNTYGTKDGLATRVDDTLTDGETVLPLKGFKAARIAITTGVNPTGVEKTSNVTKAKYLSYGGNSTSVPFGRSNGTDTMVAAFNAAKTSIQGASTTIRVALIREKV
jgi:hypothetical protein